MNTPKLKPLELWKSLLLTLVPAVAAWIALHYLVPVMLEGTGQPFFTGYMIWWMGWMGLVFVVSLVAYKLEGNPLTWQAFSSRYRLRRLDRLSWIWIIVLLSTHALGILILGWIGTRLSSISIFSMPGSFPPELLPGGTSELVPGEFMGMPLSGRWWIVALYFLGWVFNILGEEFWWRGYMLPRQELTHGRWTWVVHGLLWGANHLFQKWTLPVLFPTAFLFAYGAQKAKNTWVTIIVHGVMNLAPLAWIVFGVMTAS
jgi:membrane protease YdiL (CAAX protease family)